MSSEGRRHGWRGALGEFVVIVVGILVALAGDAWFDGRMEHREERESLVALREEFSASLQSMEASREVHRAYADAIERLLQWTGPNPRLPAADSVSALLERGLGTYASYNDRRGVLDGIIASGELRLIESDSLRAMLAGWPATVEDITEDEDLAIQFRNNTLLPYVYRRFPIEGSRFPRDFRPLFADPYFERLLDWRLRQVDRAIMPPYEFALRELHTILGMIDVELGNVAPPSESQLTAPERPVGAGANDQDTTRRLPR
jgi:hypothetical protein